ncbi:MAG TPA: alpha/beta hydrolase [Mucilaginibacter sp.]
MSNYFFTVRQQNDDGTFNSNIGTTTYLTVPDDADDLLAGYITDVNEWVSSIMNEVQEDILIYVHGYNNSSLNVVKAHKAIRQGLESLKLPDGSNAFNGKVITFDWPCGSNALMYLPDRQQAKKTAMELVNGGIALLSQRQKNNCKVNIHLLAHSTGAFVVREAFDDADDHTEKVIPGWIVTQVVFIAGDISSSSMNQPGECDSIYNHTIRLTNYSNPNDVVLAMSNLKRLGFENRAGRIGLPPNVPNKCVNVNCGAYYESIAATSIDKFYSHGWFFDDKANGAFMQDLAGTINGGLDRNVMPTRRLDDKNNLILITPH